MAALVISAAGSWIGGTAITGTVLGMTGAQIGWMAGSMLASNLIGGKNTQGPRLGDNRVQGTEYGQPFPWVSGSPRLAGQIARASPIREIANTQRVGKGGGAKHTTFTYEVDLLIKLTENPINGVSRIWINGDLVWNGVTTQSGRWSGVTIYNGDDDQMPDPIYEAGVGVGNAPANRGCGTVVIQSLQLGSSSQIPNITFELSQVEVIEAPRPFHAPLTEDFLDHTPDPVGPTFNISAGTGDIEISDGVGTLFSKHQRDGSAYINYLITTPSNKLQPSSYPGQDVTYAFDVLSIETAGSAGSINVSRLFQIDAAAAGQTLSFGLYVTAAGVPRLYIGENNFSFFPTFEPEDLTGTYRFYIPSDRSRCEMWIGDSLVYTSSVVWLGGTRRVIVGLTAVGTNGYVREVLSKNLRMYLGNPTNEVIVIPTTPPVAQTVGDLLERAGYGPSEYDVSDIVGITKPVRGFTIGNIGNTRSALEVLSSAFVLEWSKTDKIRPHQRPITPIVTIPYADLGVSGDLVSSDDPMPLQVGNELEVPAQISLTYPNTTADYQTSTEHSDRLISSQESAQQVQIPLGMTPSEAKAIADAMLFDQVASITKTTIRVGLKYARIEPGDVINVVNFDGRVYRLRVSTKRDTLSVIELECVLDDVGAIESAGITDDGYISQTEPRRLAPTAWATMDMPILRDADDEAGWYMAIAAERVSDDDIWPGSVAVQAWTGDEYAALFETGISGTLGVCTSTLPGWTGGNVFDESSVLTVRVWGELESSTKADMLLDQDINAMAIGQNGRWELVRFRNAVLTATVAGENEYTLTGFLRGQRGTEWATGTHESDDQCVLLNSSIRRVESQTSQIGLPRNVKAVTLNTLLSDVLEEVFTDTGVALKPFSPANPVFLAEENDMRATWQRRTRLSYRYGGVGPVVPLGELTEAYRVRVFDGVTLVRTVNVTSPEWIYESADIASDGFSPGDPVRLEIAQLSAIAGEGYIAEVTGTAP